MSHILGRFMFHWNKIRSVCLPFCCITHLRPRCHLPMSRACDNYAPRLDADQICNKAAIVRRQQLRPGAAAWWTGQNKFWVFHPSGSTRFRWNLVRRSIYHMAHGICMLLRTMVHGLTFACLIGKGMSMGAAKIQNLVEFAVFLTQGRCTDQREI